MKTIRSYAILILVGIIGLGACDGGDGGGGDGGNGGSTASTSGSNSSSGSEASSSGGDPCGGLGCASIVSPLFLTVVDAMTGNYVDMPTFKWNGNAMQSMCFPSADGMVPCARWQLQFPYGGTYTIDVSAMNYADASVTVDIGGPKQGECCGVGDEVDATVSMQP